MTCRFWPVLGTSWLWSDIAPNFAGIYQVKGRNIAMFPSVTLNPPWTKKYFLTITAIEVMGGDSLYGLGLFKGESHAQRGIPVQLQRHVAASARNETTAGVAAPAVDFASIRV